MYNIKMRQNAYTFRTAYYNNNDTKILNKKISLPSAFNEYTPAITFRNNFATPPMSAMRGTLTLQGLKPLDVANNSMVGFTFTVPIISDLGASQIAGRPVRTTTTTITVAQLNTLPVDHLIAVASQLAYFPASPSRDAFAPILYKLLQDAVNTPGSYGLRNEIIASIDLLVGVFPVVAVAPVVVVPAGGVVVAGAVPVVAPVAGAVPVAAPVAGAPVVAPVAGAPVRAPIAMPLKPSAVIPPLPPINPNVPLKPHEEIDRDIQTIMLNNTYTDQEIIDVGNKINALTDVKIKNVYYGYFQGLADTANIFKRILILQANGYGDPPVVDIMRDIKTIQEDMYRFRLNEVLDERMRFLGIGPNITTPVNPIITTPVAQPPGPVAGEVYKDMKELTALSIPDKKEYNKFMNTFDKKILYYTTPKIKTGNQPLGTPARDAYVQSWINPVSQNKTYTQLRAYISEKIRRGVIGDPEGILSNKRGFIHVSMV